MLTLRQRIFSIGGILAGLILAIVLFILYVNAPTEEEVFTDPNVIDSNTGPQIAFVETENIQFGTPLPPQEAYVKNLARIFVERFFTYSNQNDNVHIEDVQTLATDKMNAWISTQQEKQSSDYTGVTTQVLSTNNVLFDEVVGEARVEIQARQLLFVEADNDMGRIEEEEIIKKATVVILFEDDEWKVDGVWWDS